MKTPTFHHDIGPVQHQVFNELKYQVILGCIQIFIDAGLVGYNTRNGMYHSFPDFRKYGIEFYLALNEVTSNDFLIWLRITGHIN